MLSNFFVYLLTANSLFLLALAIIAFAIYRQKKKIIVSNLAKLIDFYERYRSQHPEFDEEYENKEHINEIINRYDEGNK